MAGSDSYPMKYVESGGVSLVPARATPEERSAAAMNIRTEVRIACTGTSSRCIWTFRPHLIRKTVPDTFFLFMTPESVC